MKFASKLIFLFIIFTFSFANAKPVPESFADLAEKLMPSVVNISTTQTVRTTTNQLPFQFPPGSPFGEMFKDFERPTERKASSLGSGFVIDEQGIVITNNHVVANAEDILVRVGEKEYEAKIIGADIIELHTGHFCDLFEKKDQGYIKVIKALEEAASYAHKSGLEVHAGHGLTTSSVGHISKILQIKELNIGHAIISDSIFLGLRGAIELMKQKIKESRF